MQRVSVLSLLAIGLTFGSARLIAQPMAGATALSGDDAYGAIRALDAMTGKRKWEYRLLAPAWDSMLATAGGLVFSGDDEGDFFALDANTGSLLWRFTIGGFDPRGSSVTYSVDGKQYIVVPSIGIYVAFALP